MPSSVKGVWGHGSTRLLCELSALIEAPWFALYVLMFRLSSGMPSIGMAGLFFNMVKNVCCLMLNLILISYHKWLRNALCV